MLCAAWRAAGCSNYALLRGLQRLVWLRTDFFVLPCGRSARILNWILSWRVWIPLARLSYTAYLVRTRPPRLGACVAHLALIAVVVRLRACVMLSLVARLVVAHVSFAAFARCRCSGPRCDRQLESHWLRACVFCVLQLQFAIIIPLADRFSLASASNLTQAFGAPVCRARARVVPACTFSAACAVLLVLIALHACVRSFGVLQASRCCTRARCSSAPSCPRCAALCQCCGFGLLPRLWSTAR